MKTCYILTLLIAFIFTPLAWGQIPRTLSYQGILSDDSGEPVTDGNYNVTFSIYDVATEGSSLWQEAQLITVTDGLFNVILGGIVALDLPFDNPYWLGVTVGTDSELTPRIQLTSSAYSLNSSNSERTGGIEASETPVANTLLPLNAEGKFPQEVLPFIQTTKIGGINDPPDVNINSSDNIEILSYTISDTTDFDVVINAQLVVEISGDGDGRYEFVITKGNIDSTMLGRGWWRPGSSAGLQAVTISFGAFDTEISGPVTYYLVGRKYDGSAKNAYVFISGLQLIWTTRK